MSTAWRRAIYLAVMVAIMPLSGWAGTYTAWRTVFGDDVGLALARFFDLQVETWSTIILFAPILDLVYGMHRTDRGWALAPRSVATRLWTYLGVIVLTGICSIQGPLREVFDVVMPADIAASVALYFRRALEGPMTVIGLMLFLDLVVLPSRRRATAPAPATTPAPADGTSPTPSSTPAPATT